MVGFFQQVSIAFLGAALCEAHGAYSQRFSRVGWQAPVGSRGA